LLQVEAMMQSILRQLRLLEMLATAEAVLS
jgi:hypothetical protein